MGGLEPCELVVQWKEQLVQPGIGHVRLELHTSGTYHYTAGCRSRLGRHVQQHRLAYAGLAEQQQRFPARS